MAGKAKSDATHRSEALKQVTYWASALKAPRITEAATRLADHARDAGIRCPAADPRRGIPR